MNLTTLLEKFTQSKNLFIAEHALGVIMALLGAFITLIFMLLNLLVYVFRYAAITWYGVTNALFMPFICGLIIVPIVVYAIVYIFKDLEVDRRRLIELQKKESQLKNNLARTYIDIINQRERNSLLSLEHEKLRGTLDNEISQRMETEQKFDDQVSFFSAIINLTPDIIIYRDGHGAITGCNNNLQRLLGVQSSEALEQLFKNNAELSSIFTKYDKVVSDTKKEVTYEATLNGVVFQMRKRPALNSHGALIGIITYGHDITNLKNEQDILEKASQEKSNFISTLSHELRTPLNGIVGLSDILLSSGHFKGDDERYLRAINVNAVTLGNIFNDVIDLNKIERERFNIVNENVKWQDFLEAFETLSSLMTTQKGLEFKYDLQGSSPKLVQTDPTRLRQVLWNLVANAVKFTKEGSVGLYIKQQIAGDKLDITFKIVDTGIGIAKEEQEKIFDMYYQVAGTKQSTGTGIGLHVSKVLTQELGGNIAVESELGHGSTFTLHFSFSIVTDNVELSPKNSKIQNKRVLLVEDVDLNILVAKSMLESQGYSVVAAKTGHDSIEQFKRDKFDLVLLDMQLPDMTGFDIADKLVSECDCKVPMIALTANVVANNQVYVDHKIIGVMSKPLTAKKLAETLANYQEQ